MVVQSRSNHKVKFTFNQFHLTISSKQTKVFALRQDRNANCAIYPLSNQMRQKFKLYHVTINFGEKL